MENKETENKTKKKWKGFRYYATCVGVAALAVWFGAKYSEQVKTAGRKCGAGIKTAGGKIMSCCHKQQQPAMEQENPGYQQQQYQPRYNNRGEFNNNKH